MTSKPTSVALYISNQPENLSLILDILNEIILQHDKTIKSSISFGIPFYKNKKCKIICYLMTTKTKEIAITFWNGAFILDEFPQLHKGTRKLMASLYFKKPEDIDIQLIKKIINKVMNIQDKVNIKKVDLKHKKELLSIELMAHKIWKAHYTPIIGIEQVEYMLEKFQSFDAMTNQMKEGYKYFTISHKEKLAGYFSIQKRKDAMFLSKVYIDEPFRGKNLFNKVLHHIIDISVENQLNKIELTVNKYNSNSIEIYKSKGFEIVQEAVFDIGNGFVMDDYVMVYNI